MGRFLCILLSASLTFGAAPVKKRPLPAARRAPIAKPLPLSERIQKLLNSSEASRGAHWGVLAVSLSTGKTIAAHNETRLFVPASNTKLFSTALALERLGPNYKFQTKIISDLLPDKDGRIIGDLRLIGGGDPTISGRVYPYQAKSVGDSPFAPLEDLAAQLVNHGVREIQGDIVGDDSRYPWDPFPVGWAVDDPFYEYGTPVSALTWNDNAFRISLEAASEVGAAPLLTIFPNISYFSIQNLVTTGEGRESKIHFRHSTAANELVVSGHLGMRAKAYTELLGVDDPALFAASALRDVLEQRGIRIAGSARAQHRMVGEQRVNGGQVLAERVSPTLSEVAKVVNKISQNLHAEILLREVAFVKRGEGTGKLGQEEMTGFLAEAGVAKNGFHFEDGSGLSRLTLLTPETAVKLLTFMHKSKNAEAYAQTLPIGGEDGTLDSRFGGAGAVGKVRAKTGSLTHVSALSGYADSPTKGRIAFSVLVNNFNAPTSEIRQVMDKIVLALSE